MTYAVTNVNAFTFQADEPISYQYIQYLVIQTTGANTNTVYDFGSYVAGSLGTFWTAVGTDSAFGQQALQLIQGISSQVLTSLGTDSEQTEGRVQVATLSTSGQYTRTVSNHAAVITFSSGDAPTSAIWVLKFLLQPKQHGITLFNPAP